MTTTESPTPEELLPCRCPMPEPGQHSNYCPANFRKGIAAALAEKDRTIAKKDGQLCTLTTSDMQQTKRAKSAEAKLAEAQALIETRLERKMATEGKLLDAKAAHLGMVGALEEMKAGLDLPAFGKIGLKEAVRVMRIGLRDQINAALSGAETEKWRELLDAVADLADGVPYQHKLTRLAEASAALRSTGEKT